MVAFFKSRAIRYQRQIIQASVAFKKNPPPKILTSKQAFDAWCKLKAQLQRDNSHMQSSDLRRDKTYPQSTVNIATSLQSTIEAATKAFQYPIQFPLSYIDGTPFSLSEIALQQGEVDKDSHECFEVIYMSVCENLSSQFNHVTSLDLKSLKHALTQKLDQYEMDIRSGKYKKNININNKNECYQVISASKDLIKSAPTVSAVITSIVIIADLLAQMKFPSPINTFPALVAEQCKSMSRGDRPNYVGSAYQLEWVRNKLITDLKGFLDSRAQLVSESIEDNQVIKAYRPIDRGFFYNKPLQNARIEIASKLLTQLECMKFEHGVEINNPQLFSQLLLESIEANNKAYEKYGRQIDGEGRLSECLNKMRLYMGEIYTHSVKVSSSTDSANLHEQLGIPEPAVVYIPA